MANRVPDKQCGSRAEVSSSVETMVDKLYQLYEELNSSEDKSTMENQFKQLLQAVRNGEKEKSLASQFITRFAEHFPHLETAIVNALFDLCEDEDVGIRKQAEKDLVIVSKKLPSLPLVATVANVYAQILQTDNSQELNTVHSTLMSLFYVDPRGTMMGLLSQIRNGESLARDRCFKFLDSKYKCLGPEVRSSEFEKCLFEEAKKTIKAVETREHFAIMMDILNSTKMVKTEGGQKAIVEIIEAMLDITQNFHLSDDVDDDVAKLCVAVDYVFPFFHENNGSASLFTYFCTRVIPKMTYLVKTNETAYFSILKLTVELAAYMGKMKDEQVKLCFQSLFLQADALLVDPPENVREEEEEIPSYKFSFIESTFYLINKLACGNPQMFVEMSKSQERLRSKIAHLLRIVIPFNVKLRKDAQIVFLEEKKDKDSLVKLVSFRTLTNISGLGRALYKAEGPCLGKILLSWKAKVPPHSATSSPRVAPPSTRKVTLIKRSRLDENQRDNKRSQENSANIYQPPNGKFSGTLSYEDDLQSPSFYKNGRNAGGFRRNRRY